MKSAIAIVGMSCRYADARSPQALWENALSQRRAFRRIPAERLRLEDYYHPDHAMPDRTYSNQGAFIDDYTFDRVQFRITGNAYRSSDHAHWLALDIAARALKDAGFSLEAGNIPADGTGVLIGNTLTGEFSRANALRLRWPYVYRVVEAQLTREGWNLEQRNTFLQNLETTYKAPFAPVNEETLAGGLSNTIAGRICNYFNLHGGGYTVDGACASSLLAVYQACTALSVRDIDMALAGGVDLSLDPFELIGFAKTAALASEEMRVFDRRSAGFLPGEGCGFVVLMRHEDAIAQQRHIYAVIKGWGMSSDGNGGITRPEVEGQLLALTRAYKRAEFSIDTVTYFEGHGTGTQVGDTAELQALSAALAQAYNTSADMITDERTPAIIGSIKANIGHTKAAAGIAGLIKATMALSTKILPPTTGVTNPHHELSRPDAKLRILNKGMLWPEDRPLRAGVSAMGFGGINTHIVLEGEDNAYRKTLTTHEQILLHSAQDTELFLMAAEQKSELQQQIEQLIIIAPKLSLAELGDLAAHLAQNVQASTIKAAFLAQTPAQLTQQLQKLAAILNDNCTSYWEPKENMFLTIGKQNPRIGFLFPGQGAPSYRSGGALRNRFPEIDALYQQVQLPQTGDEKRTDIAQVAIVTASIAAQQLMSMMGIQASVAIGHSLGELSALHWAGAFDHQTLLRLAATRGRIMLESGHPTGAMVSLMASQEEVEPLLADTHVVISGLNSPQQTTVAGNILDVGKLIARARERGIKAVRLPVSHAFHSPLMEEAIAPFKAFLQEETFSPLKSTVLSTVTGRPLAPNQNLKELLCRQIISPVLFMDAVATAQSMVDFWVEVGPGNVLSSLIRNTTTTMPVISMDAGSTSLHAFLQTIGASFVMGVPIKQNALFAQRFQREFSTDWHPQFLANPCEQAPYSEHSLPLTVLEEEQELDSVEKSKSIVDTTVDIIRRIVAEKAELPIEAIQDDSRLLSDLHLNSITVGQIVTEACHAIDLPPSSASTDYSDATVQTIAQVLEQLKKTGHSHIHAQLEKDPTGIANWVRPFRIEWRKKSLPKASVVNPKATLAGNWQILSSMDEPLTQELQQQLAVCTGDGIVLWLPEQAYKKPDVARLLQMTRFVLAQKTPLHVVFIQHEEGIAGFVRTLYLEAPQHTFSILTVPVAHPQTITWIMHEIASHTKGYHEAMYNVEGQRYEPQLTSLALPPTTKVLPLVSNEVLLVTGGGKGIAAECAISLAYETGVRLILVGRSDASIDSELAANLHRLATAGIEYRYIMADVTDTETLVSALQKAQKEFGAITGVIHGAGANTPRLLQELDEETIHYTLAPKLEGLQSILQVLAPNQLRVLITFGSVIARTGMRGEADYALANDSMAALTEQYQREHRDCRCLCIEWSVWSGVGMGERLGRIDALKSAGIMPIAPEEGIAVLKNILSCSDLPTRIIVGGRLGEQPTLKRKQDTPPFLRFLESPKVFYPGIELVAETELSLATDFYLQDHRVQGEYIVPAVVGLEAMAQAVRAVTGRSETPQFKKVQFSRPLVVTEKGTHRIRLVALVYPDNTIEVAIRSAETSFQIDHFRADCTFSTNNDTTSDSVESSQHKELAHIPQLEQLKYEPGLAVAINPRRDLYQKILFHQGRFQRLQQYHSLHAYSCIAQISMYEKKDWYARYLPTQFLLGDPATRDTVIHAIQACIPQGTLLPTAIDQLTIAEPLSDRSKTCYVYAKERSRDGNEFIYDVEVIDEQKNILEQWQGLHLRQVQVNQPAQDWTEALLGPYAERKIAEFFSTTHLKLVLHRNENCERYERGEEAITLLMGRHIQRQHRLDGKPLVPDEPALTLSLSHCGSVTLALCADTPSSVDLTFIETEKSINWQDLLGAEHAKLAMLVGKEQGEDIKIAATRIWGAMECMKKARGLLDTPLILQSRASDGWVILKHGRYLIASYRASMPSEKREAILTVAYHVSQIES